MTEFLMRTLFVHTPGTRLLLEGGAVKAVRDDAPPRRLPLTQIDSIVVGAGVDVSTPLLLRCAEDGRIVAFVSRYGKPRAIVEGPASGRGKLRRLQYQRHLDPDARLQMACDIVRGKLSNMGWALRQWARDAEDLTADRLRQGAAELDHIGVSVDTARHRDEVLGLEGAATREYFVCLGSALRGHEWRGRSRRPTRDPVNACLSFGYGLTRIAVQSGLHVVGLDAHCGFLHGDTDGQPSLALDLMEEFRPISDRVVVGLLNRRKLRDPHFEADVAGTTMLTPAGREIFMDAWFKHRLQSVKIRGAQIPVSHGALPLYQANVMANAIRSGTRYAAAQPVVR